MFVYLVTQNMYYMLELFPLKDQDDGRIKHTTCTGLLVYSQGICLIDQGLGQLNVFNSNSLEFLLFNSN